MKSVGIMGLGRFGKLLAHLLKPHFTLKTYDPALDSSDPLSDVLQQTTLFIAVPIHHFETVIEMISPQLKTGTTVIDLCSVKVHPVKVMQQFLGADIDIIATHPLFGPDSFADIHHQKKIMMYRVRDQFQQYDFWKTFFNKENILVAEMTPEQHDQYMAQSQGITHLIWRALSKMNAQSTPINTSGYNQLLNIMQHTCNDTWELFYDLQHFNPYSQAENKKLLTALTETLATLQRAVN